MNVVLHLLRADRRRLRLPIAAWFGLTAVWFAMEGLIPILASDGRLAEPLGFTQGLLWLARALLGLALIALIVHAHPVVGTTAFWLTRPMPRGSVWRSKLVAALTLFVIVPAIAEIVLMRAYHVPWGAAGGVLFDSALLRASVIVLLLVGAALTSTLGRFAVVLGAGIAALVVVINVSLMASMWWPAEGYAMLFTSSAFYMPMPEPDESGSTVAMVLIFLGGLAISGFQYRRGAPGIVVPLVVVLLVISAAVPTLWPRRSAGVEPPDWTASASLAMAGSGAEAAREGSVFRQDRWRIVRAPVVIPQLPDGWTATVQARSATFEHPGGAIVNGEAFPGGGATVASRADREATPMAAVGRVIGARIRQPHPQPTGPGLLWMRERETPGGPVVGRYRGAFDIVLQRVEAAAVLPIAPGAVFQDGPYRFVLTKPALGDITPHLQVRVSDARPSLSGKPAVSYIPVLRNAARQEAVAGELFPDGGAWFPGLGWGVSLRPSGFQARVFRVPFSLDHHGAAAAGLPSLDEAWLAGAELVIVRISYAGTIRRSLAIDGLRIEAR